MVKILLTLLMSMLGTVAGVTKVCSIQVVLDTLLWTHFRDTTVRNNSNVTDQAEIDRLTRCYICLQQSYIDCKLLLL